MIILIAVLPFCLMTGVQAASIDTFDDEIQQIEDSVDDNTAADLNALGISGVNDVIKGIDQKAVWEYLADTVSRYGGGPLSALLILTAAILFLALAESYTFSLRYSDTKEIMGAATGLFITSVVISPVTEMIASSVTVMQGAATVMTTYLPVMTAILTFSGHAISSGGYYAAVITVSQLLSRFASSVLSPLLSMLLSLSVCAGISSGIKLGGLIETVSKGFKYGITFAMSIFIAVIGLNGALTGAADSVTDKAARFTLSSFIPLIGSSIAEAYGTIQGSVGVLRSGIGVFVILAVFAAFAPLLIRTVLWTAAFGIAKVTADALGVSSCGSVLNALSQFLSALRALLLAVMTVFIIAAAVMIRIGGGG